ncbi:MAG: 50S ribosomal protein L4 [Porphyromonas sp.]|nr:50S ribosomal protein L4 [Porphyromonas sp.]
MELKVLKINGEETGRTVTLDERVFGVEPNEHAIYLDTKRFMASQRQGTHKTKGRGEVALSTRKLFRQKGTGGARRGSLKSPILKGGGTMFGPTPRSYSQKVNKKVKQLARASVLSYKAQNGEILILENFDFENPKTKEFAAILNALKISDKKSLFLVGEVQENVRLSARNLPKVKLLNAQNVSTHGLLDAKYLVITEDALTRLSELLTA